MQELVWKNSRARSTDRLVMILLAKYSRDGAIAWTTYRLIAEMANINRRSAIKCVDRLIKLGELEIIKRGSGHQGNTYRILKCGVPGVTPGPVEPDPVPITSSVLQDTGEVSSRTPERCPTGHSKESERELKVVKNNVGKQLDGQFETWWKLVPRKDQKKTARESFAKALKKSPLEQLTKGIIRYANHVAGRETRYVLLPATWLNQERWNDENSKIQPGDSGQQLAGKGGNSILAAINIVNARGEDQR